MKTTKKPIAASLAIAGGISLTAILLCGIATSAQASGKRNPYGESEDPKRAFKVHFDTTKFPELPKCTWAKSLRHFRGGLEDYRHGEVEIILEDWRNSVILSCSFLSDLSVPYAKGHQWQTTANTRR